MSSRPLHWNTKCLRIPSQRCGPKSKKNGTIYGIVTYIYHLRIAILFDLSGDRSLRKATCPSFATWQTRLWLWWDREQPLSFTSQRWGVHCFETAESFSLQLWFLAANSSCILALWAWICSPAHPDQVQITSHRVTSSHDFGNVYHGSGKQMNYRLDE
jgi:hypothetical protein